MPSQLILLVCVLFIIFVFAAERRRNAQVSSALSWPLLWYAVAASRPVGAWLAIFRVPIPGGVDPTEGSLVDRWFYAILALIGIVILVRRQCDWNAILRENAWLLTLFGFMALSILWSDYPLVSFKRLVKSLGAIVMALVVLTEPKPVEAIAAVLRRCAYITIPLSIVLIRYFRDIGVMWDWSGNDVLWQGITTSKNTLGQVAMTSALCFLWERIRRQSNEGRIVDFLYILMSLYLLKGSDDAVSMTSLSVFAVGLLVFVRLHFLKLRADKAWTFSMLALALIFGVLLTVILHTLNPFPVNSLMGAIIGMMGRDMTLTGRTEIWTDVFKVASGSPMLGVGYGAFWIGRLANIPWTENLTWTLGQAHNGYVDTYLQLGWVGAGLLMAVILSSIHKIVRSFPVDFEYGRFRMTFFLVILFVNITESTFLRGDHNMWFLFLLAVLSVPSQTNEALLPRRKNGERTLTAVKASTPSRKK